MADEDEPMDSIAAFCVDECVLWFGMRVENDLADMVETGAGADKKHEPRYTLTELLDDAFRVPRPLPVPKKAQVSGIAALLAMAAEGGVMVKRWQAVKPN